MSSICSSAICIQFWETFFCRLYELYNWWQMLWTWWKFCITV